MIKTYGNKETQKLAKTAQSKKLPTNLLKRAITHLVWIDTAVSIDD